MLTPATPSHAHPPARLLFTQMLVVGLNPSQKKTKQQRKGGKERKGKERERVKKRERAKKMARKEENQMFQSCFGFARR